MKLKSLHAIVRAREPAGIGEPRAIETPAAPLMRAAAWTGRGALAVAAAARDLLEAFASRTLEHGETASARSLVVRQVFASGVRGLPLVCVVAVGTGAAIVLQTTMAPTPPSSEFGRMLVVVVLRELAPLLTALVVAGHSGTAIAGELSARFAPLSGTRLRPSTWPRVLGLMIATWALAVHFAAVAMISGYVVSQLVTLRTFEAVRAGFIQELALFDVPLFFFKTAGLGAIVGWASCQATLKARGADGASQAFVWALLAGSGFSIGTTVALYAAIGAPQPP